MSFGFRMLLVALFLLGTAASGEAQVYRDVPPAMFITELTPVKRSEAERNRVQARKLFVRAQFLERDSRFIDAVKVYEEALKLEPEAAPLYKALVPLCFNLERQEQALEYCRKAIALDPSDYELTYRYAKELQERGQREEAAKLIARAIRTPAAEEHRDHLAEMCFSLGVLSEELKNYDQAAWALEKVASILDTPEALTETGPINAKHIQSEAAKTYERLGRVRLKAGQHEQAVAAFRKAQERDPLRAGRLHYHVAEVYLDQGETKQALEHLRQHLATQPAGTEGYEKLIAVLKQLGRHEDVLPALEGYAKRDQFNVSLRVLLAGQYADNQQEAKAEQIFLTIWKDNPTEETYRGLAKLYQSQRRWGDLLQMLDKDLGELKNLTAARPQLKVLSTDVSLIQGLATAALNPPNGGPAPSFETRRALATLARQAKQYEAAIRFCRSCLEDDPQPGEVYLELCRVLAEARKYDELADTCRDALKKKLKAPELVFQIELSRALVLAGKTDEAVAAAQQAIRMTKADTEERFRACYTLAAIYSRTNQLDKGIAECETLLKTAVDPRDQRQLHYLLSGIYSTKHDNANAEKHLQKVLEIDPEDATANNDLGYLWADQGKNLDQAEKMIRKAIELDRSERGKRQGALEIPAAERDNAAYIDSLGWVLYKRGQLKDACVALERASGLADGDDPVIWDHLGQVYYELDALEKAGPAWEKALELYKTTKRPGLEERRKELEEKLQLLQQGAKR